MEEIIGRYNRGLVRVRDTETKKCRIITESHFRWEQANGPIPEGYRLVRGKLQHYDPKVELRCVVCGLTFQRGSNTIRYAAHRGMGGPYCGNKCRARQQWKSEDD